MSFITFSPKLSADAGIGVRNYQVANDNKIGDVIRQTAPLITATVKASPAPTYTSFTLNAAELATTDDAYKDHYVVVSGQYVRKIKSYDAATNTITIYATVDAAVYDDREYEKRQCLDFTYIPTTGSTVEVYGNICSVMVYCPESKSWQLEYKDVKVSNQTANFKLNADASLSVSTLYAKHNVAANNIEALTDGQPVTLQNSIKAYSDGRLDGITAVNGFKSAVTYSVILPDGVTDDANAVELVGAPAFGLYQFRIISSTSSGAFVIGSVSANDHDGYVFRAASAHGSLGEVPTLVYRKGRSIGIKFITPPTMQNGSKYNYTVILH